MLKTKIIGLQIARALAVFLVVLAHAIGHPYTSSPGLIHFLGREGVTLFFVVSGYIMARLCQGRTLEPLPFLRKRFLRIVPLYYFVTLITIIGVLVVPWAFKDTTFDVPHIIYSLAFFPTFSPGPEHSVTPFMKLGWTLNYELFFYVCFAALYAVNAVSRAVILLIVFTALAAYGLLVPQVTAAGKFYTDLGILGFPAGVLLATFTGKSESASKPLQGLALIVGCVAIGMVALYYDVLQEAWPTQLVLVFGSTCLIYVLVSFRDWPAGPLVSGAVTIGDASYSIYLFHMFAVGLAYNIGRYLVPNSYLWTLTPIAFAGGMILGLAAYRFIEKPLLQLVGYHAPPREPHAVATTRH